MSHFRQTPNAAISGHNIVEIKDASLEACAHLCMVATFGCASFDIARETGQCWLSDVSASDSVPLTTEYVGHPYDYYQRIDEGMFLEEGNTYSFPCVCMFELDHQTFNFPKQNKDMSANSIPLKLIA